MYELGGKIPRTLIDDDVEVDDEFPCVAVVDGKKTVIGRSVVKSIHDGVHIVTYVEEEYKYLFPVDASHFSIRKK